mgnify:CR=1 FL=1
MLSLSKLLPREDKFYVLLEDLARQGKLAAHHLKKCVESGSAAEKAVEQKSIAVCKAEAKRLSAEITKQLCLTFVTPLDREDIQDLASGLYKISKTIEKVNERMMLHGIEHAGGDFSRQIDLILQETAAMETMLNALIHKAGLEQIMRDVAVLQDLENRGDAILSELLVALFKDNTNVRDLLLRKDIYDMLEKIIDRYRDVADVVLQIVLKHS